MSEQDQQRPRYEQAWQELDALKAAGGTVAGRVIERVDGGLIVDIGLRAFLPAQLVDLGALVGSEIECRIVELDRARENVVVSA